MNNIDFNTILNRKKIEYDFRNKMIEFDKNKSDLSIKRGFFFYGNPGVGKTRFVVDILKSMNYDVIMYDSGDIRNKSIIESITKYNMNDKNVISMFTKNPKKIVIVMDEVDGMNNGDKGGLASLIKLVREKKTKKQKLEDYSLNPIICIGNYHFDKKLTELKKVCTSYEIKQPTTTQICAVVNELMPNITSDMYDVISNYIDGDLRKIKTTYDIYKGQNNSFPEKIFKMFFQRKVNNEFSKDLTKKIINERLPLEDHNLIINETDRTSISLLFHENVIDVLPKNKKGYDYYYELLNTYCLADYLDRITFQKQIWIFNELTSLLKTVKGNNELGDVMCKKLKDDVRFTKILTKYSTEYNNQLFIGNICKQTQLDKSDVIQFFLSKYEIYKNNPYELYTLLGEYDINKLDIDRMYRFLKYSLP
jgi:SpoVK/Ycf46/Vps4 family AAA+-type ATPase